MTAYEWALVLITVSMSLLALWVARRQKLGWPTGLWMSIGCPLLCLLCARVYYLAVSSVSGMWLFWGNGFLPREPYDYAFGGGVLGFLLALKLLCAFWKKPWSVVSDAYAPVGLAAIAALRAAEAFSDFGWGDPVEAAWLQRYPFAISNMYDEWCAAIFNLEALCALVILAILLLRGRKLAGRKLSTGLIWWAVTQIFCESFRVESIQWGFLRVQQLQSALIVLTLLLVATLRLPRGKRSKSLPYWGGFALSVGLVIFLEYALDKMPWPTWLNYLGMAAALALMGFCPQRLTRLSREGV